MTPTKEKDLITTVQEHLETYVSFPDKSYAFTAALWSVFTHCWNEFDVIPYLVITAYTKRSGKTLLAEEISFIGANSRFLSGVSDAKLRTMIEEEHPAVYIDEAERFSSAGASDMRAMLNTGYRRGQKYSNMEGDFDTFCPKCFVLIGDVHDTLRDRSIIISMRRAESRTRSTYSIRKEKGEELRAVVSEQVEECKQEITSNYLWIVENAQLNFMENERDAEIWQPLFAIASVFCPERVNELKRVAVDLSTEKTQDMRSFATLAEAEKDADKLTFAERLLRDMVQVIGTRKGIPSSEVVPALQSLDVAPWRKYKGRGLTFDDIGDLLDALGVNNPNGKNISGRKAKTSSTKTMRIEGKVVRGYLKDDLLKAAERAGIKI